MKKLIIIIGGLLLMVSSIHAQDNNPGSDDVAVTIYNQGTALVKDQRTFNFKSGINSLDFTDVAARIDPTSVNFSSLTDPAGTIVLEQNYVYDLVNSNALMERYLDEVIEVTTDDGTNYTGTLLSGRDGTLILRRDNGEVVIIQMTTVRDIRFPQLPEGLITRPTLRWLVSSAADGQQQVELTYLTGGLNWSADYIILLAQNNTSLDINGWVTLSNTSGTTYTEAQLKLVAGDLNRVRPGLRGTEELSMAFDTLAEPALSNEVAQREFFEYQLYEIGRRVTIADNETKQIEFESASGVSANTFFVYDANTPFYGYSSPIYDQYYETTRITDVQNWLEFTTGDESGLAADLPAGRVRVYQEDVDGAALLIGENFIDHTPEGEKVSFFLGNAFDLVGERTQTRFELISDTVIQERYEIRLRNRKDNDIVEIRVPERLFRWSNWEILESSTDFTQLNASTIEFRVNIPPGEETVISYTVQYSWPG